MGLVASGVADLAGQDSNTLTARFRPPLKEREREKERHQQSDVVLYFKILVGVRGVDETTRQ